jgi:hypothetical protein
MSIGLEGFQDFTGRFPTLISYLFRLLTWNRGVWALIQATISQIDFDYASYAEVRLGEYWAWRREEDGSRAQADEEMPLRERRWAQEA